MVNSKKTEVIKIRVDSVIKEKFEIIAESEQRTFAGQVRLALSEWINQTPNQEEKNEIRNKKL